MNDTIKKIFDKHKTAYHWGYKHSNYQEAITVDRIEDYTSDIVKAIAEAVKTETEAKMAQGKYTYAHEVAEDAVEIINSFGGQNGNKDKD
jgi:hypothetical protein